MCLSFFREGLSLGHLHPNAAAEVVSAVKRTDVARLEWKVVPPNFIHTISEARGVTVVRGTWKGMIFIDHGPFPGPVPGRRDVPVH